MRIWTINPFVLDSKRLVAAWREALAFESICKILEEDPQQNVGYKNHPQFTKIFDYFEQSVGNKYENSRIFIHLYLKTLFSESIERNYNFDASKIVDEYKPDKLVEVQRVSIQPSYEQIRYELALMKYKNENYYNRLKFDRSDLIINRLYCRNTMGYRPIFYDELKKYNDISKIEPWEKIKPEVVGIFNTLFDDEK